MLTLKGYQQTALTSLENFLAQAKLTNNFTGAFEQHRQDGLRERYQHHEGLEHIPHVCLRIPTGGGKTLLAAHAVKLAARSYMERDFPVVLWLAPSDAIRQQTVSALKPGHPYYEALYSDFNDRIGVYDIADFERIRPQDMIERVCIIVGTFAALRIDDEKKGLRRLYSHNENFESHFSRLRLNDPALDRIKGPDKGKIKFSFANLLRLHRPLLILDEAHNAVTETSFKTWERINPACIIEFSATPRPYNNTLVSVPPMMLKDAQMIKLPIMLQEHEHGWQETLEATTKTVSRLRELAEKEPTYLRPIALIKAEDKGKECTVEVARAYLVDSLKIPAERVAVATGTRRELEGKNLFDRSCPIEFIITNEALKEGWDCSFAYVFCSVATVRSQTDIEQFLGRVLRMPNATRRPTEELNRAYAHVSCPTFAQAAAELVERMTKRMGFDEQEALNAILPQQQALPDVQGMPLFAAINKPLVLTMPTAPDLSALTDAEKSAVTVAEHPEGWHTMTVTGKITEDLGKKLEKALPTTCREAARWQIRTHRHIQEKTASPSEKGEKFNVLRLCVWHQDELELAEQELFEELGNWNLATASAELSPEEFDIHLTANTFEIDLYGNRLLYNLADEGWQLSFDLAHIELDERSFSRLLDPELRRDYITQPQLLEYLRRAIRYLTVARGLTMAHLLMAKYQLIRALDGKIKSAYRYALARGYQTALFAPTSRVEASFSYTFQFPTDTYAPVKTYKGSYRFRKHYYANIGDLSTTGEEFDCAVALDSLTQVKYWVRNLSRQPSSSFWLPTSTDRFYPDFVAMLEDGRILVLEYKGALIDDTADTLEKQNIGELWQEKSDRKGLFLMGFKRDDKGRDVKRQIMEKIGAITL